MRFAFLTALYPSYIESFYTAHPGLKCETYEQQKAALDLDGFAWNGAWEPALEPLGYEVRSVYANVEPLQRAWAKENGVAWPKFGWIEQIARRQLSAFSPEILFLDYLSVLRKPWINAVRQVCPSLRLVLGFSGVYSRDFETINSCDAVFSCAQRPVTHFRQGGARAFLLRHAFNVRLLSRLPSNSPSINELLFAGSIARGAGSHLEREQLIEALVNTVPMRIHCPQSELSPSFDWVRTSLRRGLYRLIQACRHGGISDSVLHRLPMIGRAADWSGPPLSQINSNLHSHMREPVYGIAMFAAMRDHAVTLNKHIDMALSEAGNSRLFEATGAGSCLLTDWKENLHEMFEPDHEVAVYRSHEECLERARWLLENPRARQALAAAGQARVLAEHTFAHRARELDQLVRHELLE